MDHRYHYTADLNYHQHQSYQQLLRRSETDYHKASGDMDPSKLCYDPHRKRYFMRRYLGRFLPQNARRLPESVFFDGSSRFDDFWQNFTYYVEIKRTTLEDIIDHLICCLDKQRADFVIQFQTRTLPSFEALEILVKKEFGNDDQRPVHPFNQHRNYQNILEVKVEKLEMQVQHQSEQIQQLTEQTQSQNSTILNQKSHMMNASYTIQELQRQLTEKMNSQLPIVREKDDHINDQCQQSSVFLDNHPNPMVETVNIQDERMTQMEAAWKDMQRSITYQTETVTDSHKEIKRQLTKQSAMIEKQSVLIEKQSAMIEQLLTRKDREESRSRKDRFTSSKESYPIQRAEQSCTIQAVHREKEISEDRLTPTENDSQSFKNQVNPTSCKENLNLELDPQKETCVKIKSTEQTSNKPDSFKKPKRCSKSKRKPYSKKAKKGTKEKQVRFNIGKERIQKMMFG